MATVEELEIIISKLLSDKAKLREEGVKELQSYLDVSGGISLCPLLDSQTASYIHSDKLLSSTWPGLVRALCQCIKLEYSSSKKRTPKPIYSKCLRTVIQKIEERARAGASLFLPHDIRNLFSHLLEAVVEAPSFASDYNHMIRQLVAIPEYCSQMSRQVYAKLVLIFLEKAKAFVHENISEASLSKEETFRTATTLHCLLQNPPGDFFEKIRQPLIEGLGDIFLHLRDESRIARKLLGSLNTVLLKDGVNLGDLLIDLHCNMKGFVMRTWKVTRDRELKDELVLYGWLQLKLRTVVLFTEGEFVEQMLQLAEKDLDQACATCYPAVSHRFDGSRDSKFWSVSRGMRHFLELAASILYEAGFSSGTKGLSAFKKQKRESIFVMINERLLKGNSLWWGTFCLLVRHYHQTISTSIMLDWLNCVCSLFEKSISEASNNTSSYEAVVWILRCLQELSVVWYSVKNVNNATTKFENQSKTTWESVWVAILHWLPLFSSTSMIADESFKLLGYLLIQGLISSYTVPIDFWTVKTFSETPSPSVLFFIASFFSTRAEQISATMDVELWKQLLNWVVFSPDKQEYLQLKTAAILALTVGCTPMLLQPCMRQKSTYFDYYELEDWAKVEYSSDTEEEEYRALETSAGFYSEIQLHEGDQIGGGYQTRNSLLSYPMKQCLLKELAICILKKCSMLTEGETQDDLKKALSLAYIISSCIYLIRETSRIRCQPTQEWTNDGKIYKCFLDILNRCISVMNNSNKNIFEISTHVSCQKRVPDILLPQMKKSLSLLLHSENCSASNYNSLHPNSLLYVHENFLISIKNLITSVKVFLEDVGNSNKRLDSDDNQPDRNTDVSMLDAEFDIIQKASVSDLGGAGDNSGHSSIQNMKQQWMSNAVNVVALFAQLLPEKTCDILFELLRKEDNPKIRREILHCLCRSVKPDHLDHLTFLIDDIERETQSNMAMETVNVFVITVIDALLLNMLNSKETYRNDDVDNSGESSSKKPPEKILMQISKLLDEASERNFPSWHLRVKFANVIEKLNLVDPSSTETLLDKFLALLHDADFRVRYIMSKSIVILFQAYTGHEDLFQDICQNFGVKMTMAIKDKTVTASEVSLRTRDRCLVETAVMTLGEVAVVSEKVEVEAVFMICANAAIFPPIRILACAILDRLSKRLSYPNRWKYLWHFLCCIFYFWVKVKLPLPTLVEVRELLVCKSEPVEFLNFCSPWLVPSLLFCGDENELKWLTKMTGKSIASLIKEFSPAIFSTTLPMYCNGNKVEKEIAVSVLQGKMLTLANLSEDDRDCLIKKNMVSIVNGIFLMCSLKEAPPFPLFPRKAVISSVRMVVDGFCGSDSYASLKESECTGVKDVLNIFRTDRIFMFILQIHIQIESALATRHRQAKLAALECLIDVINKRVAEPAICRYIFHVLLQSLEMEELHEHSCRIAMNVLNILSTLSKDLLSRILGPQLQLIVTYLVSTCVKLSERTNGTEVSVSPVFMLLQRVTKDVDPSLHQYIKDLPPFPDLPVFHGLRMFHSTLVGTNDMAHDFGKSLLRASELPPFLQLKSLQNLHQVFVHRKSSTLQDNRSMEIWSDSHGAVLALLRFVQMCLACNLADLIDLAGDFIATMGVGDPHAVVFGLPCGKAPVEITASASEGLVKMILLELKNYLIDEHVLVIELTIQTLKGVLSTEKGYKVLKSMEQQVSTYIDLFSKGFNSKVVEDLLNVMRLESNKKSVPLENDILWDTSAKAYEEWVCLVVYSLVHYCEDTILRLCQGVLYCKSPLAEVLLPHVLGSLAFTTTSNSNICRLISTQVEKHIFSEGNQNNRSIQLFLDALNELRHSDIVARIKGGDDYIRNTQNSKVYWLDIDYLQTAKVAQKCGAYFTSALYIEYWCEERFGSLTLGEPDFSDNEELPFHLELLLAVYTHVNEPDGLYGVVRSHKLIPQVRMYEHEGNWSRSMESYDLLLRSKSMPKSAGLDRTTGLDSRCSPSLDCDYNKGLMRSLQKTGCYHVLTVYGKGLTVEKDNLESNNDFQEIQYEAAWRSGVWDLHCVIPKIDSGLHIATESLVKVNFHANLYCCLRWLIEGDPELFFSQMKCAKQELVRMISLTSLESTANIFPLIIKLQILDCLSKSWDLRWRYQKCEQRKILLGPYIPSTEQISSIDKDCQNKLNQMQYQFDLFEPYLAFRKRLYQVLQCETSVCKQLLEFARFARKAGRINQAAASIYELKQCQNDKEKFIVENHSMSVPAKVEEAKILWAQGQHEMAVNLLKYVINHYDTEQDSVSVYCLAGKWLAETRSESARIILTQYLQRAVKYSDTSQKKESIPLIERKSRAFYQLARYGDSLYRSYEERLNSAEWQAALRLRKHRAKEVEVLCRKLRESWKAVKSNSAKKGQQAAHQQDERLDYTKKVAELQKQLAMDNEEAQQLESDKDSFLRIALDSYRSCLATGDKYDLRVVFRITSLWFNLSSNQEVVDSMFETVNQVKSYKFLPLVYQIASRLGPLKEAQGQISFQHALTHLVKKMALEHPYHTIYQLLALANGDRVKDKQRSKSAFIIDLDKKQAAEMLLDSLLAANKKVIQQMKQLVEIYIRLAEIEVKKEDMNKRLTLPRDIRNVRQLELVPVITAGLPVSPDARYPEGSFPYFKGLSDRVMVMMGINAPKVVECLGSDGRLYRQLAKSGNDDLRQDAVMEQLFGLVNSLLQHHPDTQKRRLGVRTYKVIPFTPSAGVLEWVDGTMPLGEYLLGSTRTGGAHARYRPGDWSYPKCRLYMSEEQDKHKAFQTVCKNFRPVFHNFFLENFSHPAEWFRRRLAYTRSVAASSMVGYIVGLGDRHSMNILIDQESAEVVHIDLGVAFEQGLMLKMPERVPFRLTRDIVDGMGVTGVEGIFRRCCEETLRVMRANKDALLTIIEVFIHDPLYKWALSPLKALQRQKDTVDLDDSKDDIHHLGSCEEAEGNRDAARALMRVKQKLDGYEGGEMRSIQGQVQQVIQDAQDTDKLCQMFPGWGAWL